MILVDEVISFEKDEAVVRALVRPECPLLDGGRAPAVLTLEHMAQSVAVYAGIASWMHGHPIRVGYVIACSSMTMSADDLRAGDELRVTVRRVWGDEQLGHFECSTSRGGDVYARASLSVYRGALPQDALGKGVPA